MKFEDNNFEEEFLKWLNTKTQDEIIKSLKKYGGIKNMEEELMLKIKNDLAELKHNGTEIEDIKMFTNIENKLVITYKFEGKKYGIINNLIEEE